MSSKSWLGWWWIAGGKRSDFFSFIFFFSFFFFFFFFPFSLFFPSLFFFSPSLFISLLSPFSPPASPASPSPPFILSHVHNNQQVPRRRLQVSQHVWWTNTHHSRCKLWSYSMLQNLYNWKGMREWMHFIQCYLLTNNWRLRM